MLTVSGVRFGALDHPEPAVKVAAVADKVDRLLLVQLVELSEERKRCDGAEREARRLLAPFVSGERAAFRVLQRQDVCAARRTVSAARKRCMAQCEMLTFDDPVAVESLERVLHGENLDCAERGVDVWVMVRMRCKAPCEERDNVQ